MNKKNKIALIVEGTKTEPLIIKNLNNIFFHHTTIEPIILPACTNIYALWKQIKEDDYETDIIELVKELSSKQKIKTVNNVNETDYKTLNRDDYSEIYLFFDFDGHNNNLPNGVDRDKVIEKMLAVFDNETENGKMSISYPMIESIKHFSSLKLCNFEDVCHYKIAEGGNYKYDVSQICRIQNVNNIYKSDWCFIIRKLLVSISCLFDLEKCISRNEFRKFTPAIIFDKQLIKHIKTNREVMIISAVPEFLLDYFKIDILEKYLNTNDLFNINYELIKNNCPKISQSIYSH